MSETERAFSVAAPSPLSFRWSYDSADVSGGNGVPGWRHSYSQSVRTVYATPGTWTGPSATVSNEFATPSDACAQGFLQIRASVRAWQSATATFNNGTCIVATGTGTLGTLAVHSQLSQSSAWSSGPSEYDVVREDGQTLRFTLQNGVINAPSGSGVRLTKTNSGFIVTDELDNVEVYDSNGVLQSITSRIGITQTLSYDSAGRLRGVTDPFGHSFTLTYNAQGQLTQVSQQ